MSGGWQVGVDVGGTFTDVVAVRRGQDDTRVAKVPSRSDDRVAALVSALRAVNLAWSDVDDLIHGTTLVTNAIVEDDFADVALIATRGFSDTLAIGRQNRLHLYRPRPSAQAHAAGSGGASLRGRPSGSIMKDGWREPMDPRSVDEAIRQIGASGVSAVAVSLMHFLRQPRP